MPTKFIAEKEVWKELRKAFGRGKRGEVAAAFVGNDSTDRLRLSKGSILVVNASEGAVRTGQTNPNELAKYSKADVRVFGNDTLHGKVYFVSGIAFVGSPNVSGSSENRLSEAMISTTQKDVVAAARAFVRGMAIAELGPERLKLLASIYSPPKLPIHGAKQRKFREFIWAITVCREALGLAAKKAAKKGRPLAKRKLRDSKRFRIEEVEWDGGPFVEKFKEQDPVVMRERLKRRLHFCPIGHIVHLEPFVEGRTKGVVLFLEIPKGKRRRKWTDLKREIPELSGNYEAKRVTSRRVISSIQKHLGTGI